MRRTEGDEMAREIFPTVVATADELQIIAHRFYLGAAIGELRRLGHSTADIYELVARALTAYQEFIDASHPPSS